MAQRGSTLNAARPVTLRQAAAGRRSRGALQRSARRSGLLFTLPVIVLLALVVILPLCQAVYYSFTDWNGADANWTGFENYASFFKDPNLRRILLNSLVILLSLPVGMIFPLVAAYLLNNQMPGHKLMRTLIFAPTALSWVVIGLVARSFFANDGPINAILEGVGLGHLTLNWLADGTAAIIAVLFTFNAAVFGINTIIFLTGLSTIDRSMIEAARLDGAPSIRILVSIVIPTMRRFVEFVFIITLVTSFSGLFSLIYVMTAGGPGADTTTLDFAVWQRAFASGDFGLAAALGIVLMVLILIIVAFVRLLSRSGDND
jgi:ABC-type sugar transport system permease subunit